MNYMKLEENRSIPFDAERLSLFKNIHSGERCFIIGNGPSLNKTDLSKLKGEITFGVNGIFYKTREIGFVPTYYVVEDNHVLKDNKKAIEEYDVKYKFFPSMHRELIGPSENTFYFLYNRGFYEKKSPNYRIPRFSADIADRVYGGQTVTYTNLQIAYYMGFSEVYLIGVDFSYVIPESAIVNGFDITSTEDDENHFHPEYFGKGKKWHDPQLSQVLKSYEFADLVFKWDGRRIYNATIGGALEAFMRKDYDSIFLNKNKGEKNISLLLENKNSISIANRYFRNGEYEKAMESYCDLYEENSDFSSYYNNLFRTFEEVIKKGVRVNEELFFRVKKNIRKNSGFFIEGEVNKVSPFPQHGSLEITTNIGCSISCKACPQSLLTKNYTKQISITNKWNSTSKQMSLVDFKEMLKKVPRKVRIDFSGFSEPYLNKSCSDMIVFATNRGHEVVLFTTLVGMTYLDLEKLRGVIFDWLYLHVPDVNQNAKIKCDDYYLELFEQVLDGGLRRKKLNFSCHGSIHPEIAKRLDERGIKYPATILQNRAGNLESNDLIKVKEKSIKGRISCKASGNQLNQNVLLPNGDIVMCCQDYGLKHVFGNLMREEYYSIFENIEYQKVRGALNDESVNILCRSCERSMPKMQAKISVIIPVYNVQKYLKKCIDSVVNQTLKDIEIIIVNDGSTDAGLEIAEQYAVSDHRIEIYTQKNKGLGGARNTGLAKATGEYVFFLDGDDYVDCNAFASLYEYACQNDLDIVVFGLKRIDKNGNIIWEKKFEEGIRGKNEAFADALSFNLTPSVANKLYRRELFSQYGVSFPEGFLHEDIPVTYRLFWYANRVGFLSQSYYYWLQRDKSITGIFSHKHIDDVMSAFSMIKNFLIEQSQYERFKSDFYIGCLAMFIVLYKRAMNSMKNKNRENFVKYLRDKIESVDFFYDFDSKLFISRHSEKYKEYEQIKEKAFKYEEDICAI